MVVSFMFSEYSHQLMVNKVLVDVNKPLSCFRLSMSSLLCIPGPNTLCRLIFLMLVFISTDKLNVITIKSDCIVKFQLSRIMICTSVQPLNSVTTLQLQDMLCYKCRWNVTGSGTIHVGVERHFRKCLGGRKVTITEH